MKKKIKELHAAYNLNVKIFNILMLSIFCYSLFVMIDKNSLEGFLYISLCGIAFFLGYIPLRKVFLKKTKRLYSFKKNSHFFLYTFLIIGTFVNIYSATYKVNNVNEFFIQLITNTTNGENLRSSYELSSEEGGVSGLLKILGGLNLIVSYIFYFMWTNNGSNKNRNHLFIAIIFLIFRFLFTLEFTTGLIIMYFSFSYALLKKNILCY